MVWRYGSSPCTLVGRNSIGGICDDVGEGPDRRDPGECQRGVHVYAVQRRVRVRRPDDAHMQLVRKRQVRHELASPGNERLVLESLHRFTDHRHRSRSAAAQIACTMF